VLLLDKEQLPRFKACGGGVSPQVAQWFDFDFGPAIDHTVTRVRFSWKLDDVIEADLPSPEPFWMVRREVFDYYLVKQAERLGVKLQDGVAVTGIESLGDGWRVQTDAGPVEGHYLVAADGGLGPMAGWLGFATQKRHWVKTLSVEAELPQSGDTTAHFEFGLVKNGFVWAFPKSYGLTVNAGTFRGQEETDFEPPIAAFLAQFGVKPQGFRHTSLPVCVWDGHHALHTRHALLVGEAAALADPFTAEGIRPALLSGLRAAEAIGASLQGNSQALAHYSRTLQQEWGNSMAWAKRIGRVFHRVPQIAYQVGVKRPTAPERMGQILVGEVSYGDIANRVIRRMTTSFLPGRRSS
jgi:geranylgeranyl reductase family protein